MEKHEIEQMDVPMILAVEGHLKMPRGVVAYELAKHLKYSPPPPPPSDGGLKINTSRAAFFFLRSLAPISLFNHIIISKRK